MIWYQQRVGEMPKQVLKITANTNFSKTNNPRYNVEATTTGRSLKIIQVKKDDEGIYFCGIQTWDKFEFSSGTFLTIQGN